MKEYIRLSQLQEKLNNFRPPSDVPISGTIEEKKKNNKRVWKKQKALEAMKNLKGSGNGKLIKALLKDRKKETLL